MLASSFQLGRRHGDDRFFCSVRAFRGHHQNLARWRSDSALTFAFVSPALPLPSTVGERRKPETCKNLEGPPPAPASLPSGPGNLNSFLKWTSPSVQAQYLPKMKARDWRTYDFDYRPYFTLRHLWESFQEWSAYGAGVPLVLESGDSAVQYYVPYLSGIQLYGQAKKQGISSKLLCNLRREESDSDSYQDSSSDGTGSSHGEYFSFEEVSSSDEGDAEKSQGHLLFEYFEQDSPYVREPLSEKMLNLSSRFPELCTLTSYDLLPASWISVAWYPIYRIPIGPTLKDVDTCFLTYHSLSTPLRGAGAAHQPIMIYPKSNDLFAKISIPAFALASYKFRSSLWTSTEGCEKQLTASLLQAADDWLRLLRVNHPDYKFFVSDGTFRR
ncbi:uncharacterized protein LOC141821920 [Curcuma longa]|uniref:uncharacterized protein LOC141821920 n=1 Tax=Curcuma longa TaxID=136217 RepID=UPI003D9F719B